MNELEIETLKRAVSMLQKLIAGNKQGDCPVAAFARDYLSNDDATKDVSCEELWALCSEISAAGYLTPLRKIIFYRRLPGAMAAVFKVRKSKNLMREGKHVRGFLGIAYREEFPEPNV